MICGELCRISDYADRPIPKGNSSGGAATTLDFRGLPACAANAEWALG